MSCRSTYRYSFFSINYRLHNSKKLVVVHVYYRSLSRLNPDIVFVVYKSINHGKLVQVFAVLKSVTYTIERMSV